jgi:2-polyprenyl-3-methyl-5-hydroxy-6-metoxy-1,4-benzoquinol methylase
MLNFYKSVAVLLMTAGAALAQDFGDTPYVQTPMNVVERMLQMAKVSSRDYVIDLGSGDGRMVLTAVKKYGARGFGVDLDRRLVELANRTAAKTGVADRAAFYERDLYETDFSAATVMTIYLLPEVNQMVRPKLLATLKPGTRVITHDYDMGEWQPDEQIVIDAPDKPVGRDKKSKIFFWLIPANAAGKWRWELPQAGRNAVFELSVAQNFQMLTANATLDGRALTVANPRLAGDQISFELQDAVGSARYEFSGRIVAHNLSGGVKVVGATAQRQLQWEAARTELGTPAHALLKKPTMQELQEKMQP